MKSGNSSARGARCREGEIAPTCAGVVSCRRRPQLAVFASRLRGDGPSPRRRPVSAETPGECDARGFRDGSAPSASLSLEEWRYG